WSYNLSIQYRSVDPKHAAQIVNAIAEAYITEQFEGKYESTRRATQWLEERIEELDQKKKLAERAVVDFKKNNDMIMADGKLVNEQQIVDLNTQLATARRQTSEAKARLDRTDAVISDTSLSADMGAVSTGRTLSEALNISVIAGLRTRYLELVNREA